MFKALLDHFSRTRKEDSEMMMLSVEKLIEKSQSASLDHSQFIRLKEMNKLTENDDIHFWFRTFENLVKRYKVKSEEVTRMLEPYLTGPAQQAYFALSDSELQNYTLVKETILLRYRLTPAAYRG